MDQIKIGKFIAERRKLAKLTQGQLAERFGITDRAVSKWETGKAMPDSSLMLELCDVLGITVNDLLSGEVINMENYNKEMEQKLIELVKEKEESDKRLLALEWVVGIFSVIILLVPIELGAFIPNLEDWQRVLIVCSGVIPAFVGIGFAIKIEQVAGYYKCKLCGHHYVPTFKAVLWSPHFGRTRHMRCPKCGKRSWQKKVVKKDN